MSRNGRVKVFVRIRPTSKFADKNIELLPDGKSINIHCSKDQRRGYINNQILDWNFTLDKVLHNVSQDVVYDECAKDILTSTLGGYNGTIMTYGQTGAGKTFTMTGSTERFEHRGIIPRAIQQLFREISERPETAVTVRVSYMEIYNECMYDLLTTLPGTVPIDPSIMTVTEEKGFTQVKGLSIHTANNEEEALNLLFEVCLCYVVVFLSVFLFLCGSCGCCNYSCSIIVYNMEIDLLSHHNKGRDKVVDFCQ